MKNWLLLGVLILGLSSCGSPEYEKAIADWVQTDKDGTWTDLDFELVEVQSIEDITVSDSLSILKKRFEILKKILSQIYFPHLLVIKIK